MGLGGICGDNTSSTLTPHGQNDIHTRIMEDLDVDTCTTSGSFFHHLLPIQLLGIHVPGKARTPSRYFSITGLV